MVIERLGVGAGDLVAVRAPLGPAWMGLVAELWACGAAILPLDPRLTDAEMRAIIERGRPALVLDGDEVSIREDRLPVDERVALVMPTSGAAGVPKLAELSREAVTEAVRSSVRVLDASPNDRWVAWLTPAHVGGMLVLLRRVILGVPVDVQEGPDFDANAASAGGGPVFAAVVPTVVYRLVERGGSIEGLVLLVGGGRLDPSLRERAVSLGARVVTTYGLTETCGGIAYDGLPFSETDLRLSERGAIEVRGPTVMEGYRGDPQATALAFTSDGWLRTGDIGALDTDGRVDVHGRADDLIRTGGEKVWPDEVEAVVRTHPGVTDVAVAGRPDPEWGEHVAAFVVPTLDAPPTLEEIREHAAVGLARYKLPRELTLVAEIPRTSSGKIRRHALGA